MTLQGTFKNILSELVNKGKCGTTTLSVVSQEGHKEIVDLLLQKEVTIDKAYNNGFTPLKGASVASFMGHLDVATEAQF